MSRLIIAGIALMLAGSLWAQGTATPPASAPAATAPAPANNNFLTIQDANGRPIGKKPNPEASRPWNAGADQTAPVKAQSANPVWQFLNILLPLALVLALMYAGLWAVKTYYAGGFRGLRNLLPTTPGAPPPAPRLVRVLENTPLGPGRALYLVAVGKRVFLIASSGQQLTTLGEVTGDAEIEAALQQPETTIAASPAFLQVLNRFMAPATPPAGEQTTPRQGGHA